MALAGRVVFPYIRCVFRRRVAARFREHTSGYLAMAVQFQDIALLLVSLFGGLGYDVCIERAPSLAAVRARRFSKQATAQCSDDTSTNEYFGTHPAIPIHLGTVHLPEIKPSLRRRQTDAS